MTGSPPPYEPIPHPTLVQITVHSALHGGGPCLWSPRQLCPEYVYTAPRVIAALAERGMLADSAMPLTAPSSPDPECERLVGGICNACLCNGDVPGYISGCRLTPSDATPPVETVSQPAGSGEETP